MLSKIKTGVIGVGSMGKNHARIYNEVSDFIGVSDLNEKIGNEIADKYGVKFFPNYEDLLKEVDAVTIAVPTKYHLQVSKSSIESNTHLLIEKPLSSNYEDAKKILDLHKNKNIVLTVGHIERHNPVVIKLKQIIDQGLYGHPVTLSTKRFSSFPGRIVDVGVIFDLAIHDIDILCHLSGSKAVSVCASGGKNKNDDYEDFVSMLIDFENGTKGLCEANWLTPFKVRKLDMTSDEAFIEADYMSQSIKISKSKLLDPQTSKSNFLDKSEVIKIKNQEPLKNEITNFLNSISNGKKLLVEGSDGLQAVKIAESAVKSIKTGNKIYLNGDY